MENLIKRYVSLFVCIVMLASMVFAVLPPIATAATSTVVNEHFTDYSTIATIYNQGDCPSMQACAADGDYIYCSKINTDTETSAVIARVHKDTGSTTWLTNSATGTKYFSQLAHANDLFVTDVGNVKTMFVATGSAGKGEYSIVRFALSGTTLTEVGHYRATYNGTNIGLASADVVSVSDTEIKLICKRNNYVYTGTVGVNQTSGEVPLKQICTLNLTDVTINGTSTDISGFVTQGFEYVDNKLFVPMAGDSNNPNLSCIVCYDLEGASGTIKNDPSFSTWIVSSTYANLFEIENCAISPSDGKMYFSTNRRKTSSDANHDGIHILTGFVYDPAKGDSTEPGDYRWEMIDDQLVPVTTGGAIYNGTTQRLGSVSNGTISDGRYSLDQAVILNHDEPWVLEWKSSSWTANSLLFSTYSKSGYEGNYYIFRRKNSDLIAIGECNGGQYDNYGLKLSDYGVNGSKEHVYRMENRIASDGSNMVYLIVDGTELGAMNQYYIGSTSQGTTSDWISGKDFAFSYFGTPQHMLGCSIEYIQVWGRGVLSEVDEPDTFRWETQSNAMTNISEFGLTPNAVTKIAGSCTNGVYSGSRYSLDEEIVLLHDRPWSVEWQAEGSGTARFISTSGSSRATPYILKSNLVAIGHYDGTQYNNYGLSLADFGIDHSVAHVYRMTNRIAADGSNMVYLYVDGVELGAMNNLYYGGTFQTSDANWISGKDFTLGYLGTMQHPINNFSVGYLQVWEAGIPADNEPNNYRWEPQSDIINNITTGSFTANALTTLDGSIANSTFDDAYYRLEKSIVLTHDNPWSIEWQSEGTWKDSSNGAMLLSASNTKNALNAPYLYRRNGSTFIAFGERRDGSHQNYGVSLSGHGIDGTVSHVYRLTNRIAADGSNMVYLFVDGEEIGPMNEYFVGGTAQGTTSDWVSGKDFVFSYMGTAQFPIGNCSMDYIQVFEGCSHSFGTWNVTNSTCTAAGSRTRTCSLCGEVETETIPVIAHTWTDGTCQTCGTSCNHVYVDDFCTVCGMKEVKTYYLVGYINNSDYGCESDHENLGQYKFVDGSLTATFESDSYVFVKTGDNNNWYMAQSYITSTTGTFYNTNTGSSEKMYVLGGVEVTFTLTENSDGSLTLSYATASTECDHSYTSQITTPAGCLSVGVITYTCSKCGDSYTEAIRAAGHDYEITVVAPTCENNGYTIYACKNCHYSYNSDPVNPTGHDYSSVVTAPTCTEGGYTTYTCGTCGDSYTADTTAATGHSYSGGVCTVCGHIDSEYAPDYYLFGYINGANYACEEDAANLGEYKFVDGKLTATFTENSYVAVKTGDNVNWYMTNGWLGEEVTSATLYNTTVTGENSNKLFVPGGVEITFTLVVNQDGTLSLSYVAEEPPVVSDSDDIKWQITRGTNADSASTNLRLVSWVSDVDDYESVTFNVTINGSTVPLVCTTAYTAIKASGLSISNPAGVFGEESANYFVTHTIMGIPAALFDSEILVTVTWTDLEGNSVTSDLETIVISNDWA